MNVNVNLTVEKITRIKSGIMINIGGMRAKIRINKKHAKKIIFGILLHVVVKRLIFNQELLTIQ